MLMLLLCKQGNATVAVFHLVMSTCWLGANAMNNLGGRLRGFFPNSNSHPKPKRDKASKRDPTQKTRNPLDECSSDASDTQVVDPFGDTEFEGEAARPSQPFGLWCFGPQCTLEEVEDKVADAIYLVHKNTKYLCIWPPFNALAPSPELKEELRGQREADFPDIASKLVPWEENLDVLIRTTHVLTPARVAKMQMVHILEFWSRNLILLGNSLSPFCEGLKLFMRGINGASIATTTGTLYCGVAPLGVMVNLICRKNDDEIKNSYGVEFGDALLKYEKEIRHLAPYQGIKIMYGRFERILTKLSLGGGTREDLDVLMTELYGDGPADSKGRYKDAVIKERYDEGWSREKESQASARLLLHLNGEEAFRFIFHIFGIVPQRTRGL